MRLRYAFFFTAVLGALGLVVACSSSSSGGTGPGGSCGSLAPGSYTVHTTVAAGGTNCPAAPMDQTLMVGASDGGTTATLDSGVPGCTLTQNGCELDSDCLTDNQGITTDVKSTTTLNGNSLTTTSTTKSTMDTGGMVLFDCTQTSTWTKQ